MGDPKFALAAPPGSSPLLTLGRNRKLWKAYGRVRLVDFYFSGAGPAARLAGASIVVVDTYGTGMKVAKMRPEEAREQDVDQTELRRR